MNSGKRNRHFCEEPDKTNVMGLAHEGLFAAKRTKYETRVHTICAYIGTCLRRLQPTSNNLVHPPNPTKQKFN